MANAEAQLSLTADDIARLLDILRNSATPVTTEQLVAALKQG